MDASGRNISNSSVSADNLSSDFPTFKHWKGAEAQDALRTAWEVSGGNKDFVLTMFAENGAWNPYRRHPDKNKDGSCDWSFGLNSYYHKPMIAKIQKKEVGIKEIMEYHYNIFDTGLKSKRKTSCGVTPFCGYNKRNKYKHLINWP